VNRKRILRLLSIAFALLLLSGLGWFAALRLGARATLQVDASISGAEQPRASARAVLYLLNQDIFRLALPQGGELTASQERVFREKPELRNLAEVMNARRREAYSLGTEVRRFVEDSRPLWQPRIVQTAQADESGRARFSELEPGDYWLMMLVETDSAGGVAFWHLPVSLARGENIVKLDPRNSLQCSSC
jgi:hypothetical protein